MRKLKLQMQLSVDGFVARENGALDWMTWDRDDDLLKYITDLTDSVDTILMGRKMTNDFIVYWLTVLKNPGSDEFPFAQKMIDIPKVVFTRTVDQHDWINTTLAKGDLVEEVNELKKKNGKGIVVYGGAGFVSSLIKENLIDEYHLFVNPTAIGKGMQIFNQVNNKFPLRLVNSTKFKPGIVINQYEPVK